MLAAYAKNYRRLWDEHWWWQARRRFVLRRLDALAARRPLKRILDVGCGDGLFFGELARFGEVWGVEPDAGLVDPRGEYAARIRVAPFEDAGVEGGCDLILMLDALEHMQDDGAALRRAFSLLAPGGFLFLTVPALPSLWSVHDEANRHYRRYTRESLGAALSGAGLRAEELGYYFGWPVLPMFARKLLGGGPRAAGDYSVLPPARAVNGALYAASVAEQALTGSRGTPIGSSLFAAARRPEAP
ncbi:MAG TPA: class I SAM-dependent methyltransferase [Elusimicrobiota bacterium]|jgi:SAM-dependent methyltransferase|nr:class I SAM-dependent methyltransferase [Elusimicrobiota bacterium]